METFTTVLFLVVLVFGVLQIILFFKIWGMTNNVAAIRRQLERKAEDSDSRNIPTPGNMEVGATVVCIDTEDQHKITSISEDGKFVCAKAGIEIGSFSRDQLMSWAEWLKQIGK